MTQAGALDGIRYVPPAGVQRRYLAKKTVAFLMYGSTAAFVAWLVSPGVTSPPALNLDYLTLVGGLFIASVALLFLTVVTWNERLVRIEDGRLTWPFPFRKEDGTRTRCVSLQEVTEARQETHVKGRLGLELTLRDGTRMFLPGSVIGDGFPDLFDRIVRCVNRDPEDDSAEGFRGT